MQPIIENIGQQFGAGAAWIFTSTMIFLRYAIPASLVFFLVYKWKRKDWFYRKIQQAFPKAAQIRHEIGYSLLTSLLFGGMALGIFLLRKAGYGELYFDIAEHGWAYYFFTIAFMIAAHDTYFYWMHRLMHHPKLYRLFHLVHHKSANPTPYASFSFHPLESLLEFAIVPLLTLVLPIHFSAFFLFTAWSILFNVMGHAGYEFSPSGFTRHRFFKWLNTPTHHNMHHRFARYNYGLYFNFWDRVMGTNHPEYDRHFEEVVSRDRTGESERGDFSGRNFSKISPRKITALLGLLLLSAMPLFSQTSLQDLKAGNYGTPESRTLEMDEKMRNGLTLKQDQVQKVHEINLRYAKKAEVEVVKADLSDWSKYRKLTKIQKEKDKELKAVLTQEQFKKYEAKRDELFWEAVQAYFF